MKSFAIYLRKSRADMEAEARGEGETLARHRTALLALADRDGYHVGHVYAEVVSGDTIAARPQMQALLSAVQEGQYAGVIVNDIDRLSRGNMADQAIVQQTFSASGTLIITPQKVYDPRSDIDSTFVDMSLFMARFEYRQIKKRMEMGRLRSAAEGNYQAGSAPFGYAKVRNAKRTGYTLEIVPEQADIVRMIYDMYIDGTGKDTIAQRLDTMGIKTKSGKAWNTSTIYDILRNPVYIGRYDYGRRARKKPISSVENAFPPIVVRDKWQKVQDILTGHVKPAVSERKPLSNPLAGLIRCSICGRVLQQNRYGASRTMVLSCPTKGCKTISCPVDALERLITGGLHGWCIDYRNAQDKAKTANMQSREQEIARINRNIEQLSRQLKRAFEMLEQEVYTPQEFIARKTDIQAQIDEAQKRIDQINAEPDPAENIIYLLPQVETVIDAYPHAQSAEDKNRLLKSILAKVEYSRTVSIQGKTADPSPYVTIRLYPKIFRK